MSPSISVIVPVYQSESTLRRCLDSLLTQTIEDIEVILIDDGSEDRSADICEEYAKKDERVRVFKKDHSGVSDTRQLGLENARGEYIIHCDSDDWMESNMLESLYKRAIEKNADMVICDFYRENKNETTVHREFPKGLKVKKEICKQVKSLSYSLCNKLVRASLFRKYNISFPQGILMAEDVYVTLMLLNHPLSIEYLPIALYHYDHICEKSTVTTNLTREAILSNIQVIDFLNEILDSAFIGKLNSNKKKVLIDAFRNNLLKKSELKYLYPEVHSSLLFTAMKDWSLLPLVI